MVVPTEMRACPGFDLRKAYLQIRKQKDLIHIPREIEDSTLELK